MFYYLMYSGRGTLKGLGLGNHILKVKIQYFLTEWRIVVNVYMLKENVSYRMYRKGSTGLFKFLFIYLFIKDFGTSYKNYDILVLLPSKKLKLFIMVCPPSFPPSFLPSLISFHIVFDLSIWFFYIWSYYLFVSHVSCVHDARIVFLLTISWVLS